MSRSFFFAGGGTGGHIYPALAVAQQIAKRCPEAQIHFFCSDRDIDSKILSKTKFQYSILPAKAFSLRPLALFDFFTSFIKSTRLAGEIISQSTDAVVIGAGGFVSAPACWAAHKSKVPFVLLNVDIIPGRANKLLAGWADEIFVQFGETAARFGRYKPKVNVVGCPLRQGFDNPDTDKAKTTLALDKDKKILLITGGSSGAANINKAVCMILDQLNAFADNWQIVHLTGSADFEKVKTEYANARIIHKVLDYYDDMPSLLSAADLVIGRSGAMSVAEYTVAQTPSICMPYPYHKDMHQYLNAAKLVEAGAAIIVDDVPDEKDRAEWLAEELKDLLKDDTKRQQMKQACTQIANKTAAANIADKLLK